MRDLAFIGFLVALLALGFKRPFLWVLAYAYVDIVSPQRLSYYMLNAVPLSLIVAAMAMLGWLLADDKKGVAVAPRQGLMLLLLLYAGFTTVHADFPVEAWVKWDWVWKSIAWAIFLPFVLRNRLRIEAYLLFMVLSAAAIIIVGGIKTLFSGGGYGTLNLMVESNSGLYEGSTISAVAIAIVPILIWLSRFGTIFPPEWRVRLFTSALIFACLLIPVGTEARTGLVCVAALALLMLRDAKRRLRYVGALVCAGLIAVPLLPSSFTDRMDKISGYEADSSAQTRLAVWGWTWDYAKRNPLGGGFGAYRGNEVQVNVVTQSNVGNVASIKQEATFDRARAYHSSYFEVLGEQGFPGLFLYLLIHGIGLLRMEILRRRYRSAEGDQAWISPLATALQNAAIICLIGGLFLGIAYQPFVFMLLAIQIGFDLHVSRRPAARAPWRGFRQPLAPKQRAADA